MNPDNQLEEERRCRGAIYRAHLPARTDQVAIALHSHSTKLASQPSRWLNRAPTKCERPNGLAGLKSAGSIGAKGFSLISAIFLLVVIAALGTFAVTLSTTQHTSSAQDVLGSRAYQAARSGIEWGAYQALRNNSCAGLITLPAGTLAGTLSGFSVNVVCASSDHIEAGTMIKMYQLTSTAQQGVVGTSSYVEREIRVVIAK